MTLPSISRYIETVRWSHPSSNIISGPSGSGKTSLLDKILKHKDSLFDNVPKEVIVFLVLINPNIMSGKAVIL